MVSVRLVTADSYQAQPLPQLDPSFSEFRGSEIKHVPVIRIFGTTTDGEKTCLHIHGVFPYLFVPYTGEEDPQILAYRLAASLDAAINVSLGSATSNSQHVYSIQRVSGTPFYGYHRKEHQFFKIYFYNPAMIKRAADLLQNGSVLNQSLQPHEAHINYILQFMMDYNIYGMSFVNLRSVKHRRVMQTLGALASSGQSVSSENSEITYLPMEIERQSTCELEIDARASDILNRLEIDKNLELNPGLATIWDEERARRAQAGFQGGDSQLVNPKSPARPPFHPTDNDIYQDQRLARRLLMISQGDESTLSTTSNRSVAYAAEVRDGENLLNASRVPNVSVDTVERINRDQIEDSLEISRFMDVSMMPASQILTQENSILGVDDMPLIDLLAQLARENDENSETVDADSLLGSQRSVLLDGSDKMEKEDEDEEEDVEDLNLTLLDLDSLSSLERASEKQELARNSGTEKNGANALIISPFLSPWETPSCSPKSVNDVGETEDSRYRMPQYDGAGDVSPSLLHSDDEDKEENTNNAKELDHLSEFNCTRKATDPRKTSRQNLEVSKSTESLQNSSAEREILPEETCSEIADICVGHYCVVDYEPFDRMLEMGNDLIPDFADMQSSMEIGILMSSEDSEKAESMGEINNEQEIVLETVLNGDPCFTESAELDKSDVTELHDQYVSLMGNALLPDLPRINNDLDETESFTERQFGIIDKAGEVSSHSRYECVAIGSPDSSSSSENVAPNVQKRGFRGLSHPKSHDASDDCEPSNCKEQTRLGNDAADYNCNVVATWAELQNLQIIDKSEDGRTRRKNRKFLAGPRSMKRRGVTRFRPDNVTSQVFRENTEKMPLTESNDVSSSPEESSQHSVFKNPNNLITSTSGVEEKTTEQTSNIIGNDSEQLPCSSLNVPKISQSSNKDSIEESTLRVTDNIDPDNRQIISPNDRPAKVTSTLPTDNLTEGFVVTSFDNFAGTSENDVQNLDVALNIDYIDNDLPISFGTSYYSSKRSENLPEVEDRRHRHCVVSQSSKIIHSHVFTSDELWIIHKKKRRGTRNRAKFASTEAVCTSQNCKLPVVCLRKIEQRHSEEIVIAKENKEIVVAGENEDIVAGEVSPENLSQENLNEKKENPEDSFSLIVIETNEKNVELPTQSPKKTRRKREVSPLINNKDVFQAPGNIDSSTSVTETKLNNPVPEDSSSNDLLHTDKCHRPDRLKRGTYNTRRRPIVQNFARQHRRNARRTIENENEAEREKKAKAKTKETKLPGIPGIPIEIPKKRRRSRNNTLVKTENTRDNEELPKMTKPTKAFQEEEAARETPKYLANDTSRKARKNGLVLTRQNVEILPEKNPDGSPEPNLAISPVPKKNTSRKRNRKNPASKCLSFSSSTKILEEPEGNNETHVVKDRPKSPETIALSSMLKNAKSRSMRTKLKLLLRKRINEKYNGDKIETKFTIKRYPRKEKKVVSDKVLNEANLEISINNEPLHRSNKESGTILEDKMENLVVSDAPSFETVTDTSADDMSEKNDVSIGSLENARDFDGTTLIIEYSDPPADIFDNEASVDSVIAETHDVTEFSNGAEQLTYDTDRYENAIKEANFFAGKDYSIDAVSNEIPKCLFEEDSNSTDKRLSKRTNDDFIENLVDSFVPRDVETISELSVDSRDFDVYDVQSFTSSSSSSNLDETNDVSESSQQIFHDYNTKIGDAITNDSDDDEKSLLERILNASFEKTVPEDNLSVERESPSFEALSPEPQINLSIGSSIEKEFTVQSKIRDPKDQNIPKDVPKSTENENLSNTIKNSSEEVSFVMRENLPITITPGKSHNFPRRITSETPESSPKNISGGTSRKFPKIISSETFKDSHVESISKCVITADKFHNGIQAEKIEETNEKLNSTMNHSVAQVVTDFRIELEISEANKNESLTNTEGNINFSEVIEKKKPLSINCKKHENLFLNTSKENGESILVEDYENISKSMKTKLENRMFDENEKELPSNLNEERELQSFDEEERQRLYNHEEATECAKIIEDKKLPESFEIGNYTKSPIRPECDKEAPEAENVSELSISCNSEKNLSESLELEIPPSAILVMRRISESPKINRELSTTFAKKFAKENGAFLATFEKRCKCSVTIENGEKVANSASIGTQLSMINTESSKKIEKENPSEGTAEKNQMLATVVQLPTAESEDEQQQITEKIIVKECKSAEEQVERSIGEIEDTTFLSKESREEQVDSKIQKTEENSENFELNIRSRNNNIQEITKSISVDINKNDVVSVPETENRGSKITQKRKESRPISIKLIHIDLSKISCLAPKILQLQGIAESQESSEDNEKEKLDEQLSEVNEKEKLDEQSFDDNEKEKLDEQLSEINKKEKLDEKLSTEIESEEIPETPVEPINSRTSGVENVTDPEMQDIVHKQIRRHRRKIPRDTRMPERRSVRICAEMTLKLSQKESSSKITAEAATAKEEMPNTATVTDTEEERADNVEKITDAPTRPEAKSLVQESKTHISQELVLAEQTIMDENSAPIKTKRGESRRKTSQTNSQEISLPKVADENTAPIFDNSTRNISQINVQETVDDLKSSKPIEKKVVENMSTEIEAQPVDFTLKISETQADSENVISSKRFRTVDGRFDKIPEKTRVHSPTKSASNKKSREKTRIAYDSKSSMKNMHQGLTSSMIISPPTRSLNNALKKIFVLEKNDESLIEESEVPEEPVQKIKKKFTGKNEIKQQIGKHVNVMTKIPLLPEHDLLPEKIAEEITTLNNPPLRKRGRPRKIAQIPLANENLNASVKSQQATLKEQKVVEDKIQSKPNDSQESRRLERGKICVGKKHKRSQKLLSREENSSDKDECDSTEKSSKPKSSAHQTPDESKSQSDILIPRRHRSVKTPDTNLHKISSAQSTTTENSHDIAGTTSKIRRQEKSKEAHIVIHALESPERKTQLNESGKSKKRVHFVEDSVRKCARYWQGTDLLSGDETFDVHTRKHYKKSRINCSPSPAKLDIVDANDKQSLCERLTCSKKDVKKIQKTLEAVDSGDKQKVLHTSKTVPKPTKKRDNSRGSKSSRQSESLPNSDTKTRLKKPIIRLKRLSRNSLKRYGIVYRWKEKKFVKMRSIVQKKIVEEVEEDEEEFQVPAYDGAADLSSSEEEDKDVTIAREEKRVCTYSSAKNSVSKGETVVKTPLKRKLEMESEALSPKRQTLGTKLRNETPKKGSFNSPNRTSTLKTPGRNAANYSPLKIIVTSPKVRKDILESRQSRSGKLDDEASSSGTTTTTPSRKNSRLHDTMLRGRINSVKSLGDERASVGKVGSKAVGELDEIRSIGEKNDETSHLSSRIRNSGMILKVGKDVRKKLSFLDQDSSERIDELPTKKVQEEIIALRIILKDINGSEKMTDNGESTDVPMSLKGSTSMEAVAGPSRGYDNCERPGIYHIETRVDSDEDENDEDVCNVTFTQFIKTQKNQEDATFLANLDEQNEESNNRITIIPKFRPPSRERVIETMEQYGIPKFRNQEPFFSESVDVPKQKELAHKILKVPGKGVEFLPQFVSSLEEVTGIGRWRKMWLNEFHTSLVRTKESAVKMALASNEKVLITPIALPPTQKQVKDWLRARDYLNRKKAVNKKPKIEAKEQTVIEIPDQTHHDENCVSSPHSSDSSVIEPSPERTLVSKDLERTGNTTLTSKLARRGSLKSCVLDHKTGSQELNNSKEESLKNSNNSEPDPSLLDVLQKSRLFRDQEASRHLGISCGQIEFLSDSTRSNVTNENLQKAKALIRYQYLTIMCLEVHVVTRGDLLPDTHHDPIAAIFYSVQSDVPPESSIKPLEHGVIVVADSEKAMRKMYYSYASNIPWKISFVNNEEALLNALVTLITRTDPEILIGWEIETLSWGYVFQRASSLGMNLLKRVSRIPATQYKWEYQAPEIEKLAEVKLPGRIVLDIWRIMRHEAALLSYTFESVIHHVLNERIPCPSFKILTDWWNLEKPRPSRWRVVEHYSIRILGVLRILDQLDIVGRTSELARLFGIQFFEVFSRGSQFRVESVMLRLAKPLNYIAVSPSPQQRASMRAMEALPLILEPESMLYSDPLIVLDFQSLYPSIIIAHNICFSTCLGRIEHIGQPQPFEFGAYTLRVPKRTALKLQGKINYAPCGVAYVKPEVRLGILPRMLTEILETRFMVKKAMKDHDKNDKTLQRALHSRQMGLKFLANVTYGYTAANFSGRMPCIEVGDSVVSKSKETLERAIKLVEATPKWGARVVYGDTDSLFILVPGKSKDEAFVIGNEIADAVTASNLPPIKLKFEKVLYPAILQTKKRYCGYMYETPDQETPTYLAKGIETVRRDGCPAVSKILEKSLKILFETKNVSLVKKYVTRQLDKVLRGKVSIQDLTFAKEFRGLKGYKAKACVPTLELTRRLMRKDPRAVPRTSERVRYVIVAGAPNQALIHCVRTPWELMRDPGLRPNAIYYVTRVIIPPLNRCLNLMGVDVNEWYKEMPHRQILDNPVGQPSDKQKLTIFQYFGTIVCVACGQPSNKGICTKCLKRPADTLIVIYEKLRWLDRTNNHVTAICQSCVGQGDAADCGSLDCPVLYRRAQAERELSQAIQLRETIKCGNNLEF